jgi:hypothetical protein
MLLSPIGIDLMMIMFDNSLVLNLVAFDGLDGNVPDTSKDTANVPSFPRTWGCPRTMWLEIG